jgi:predicted transcriptional regulator
VLEHGSVWFHKVGGRSVDMLPKVDWMVPSDTIILLFLSEHRWRFTANPAVIARNLGMSRSQIARRCKKLAAAGLIELYDESGAYYRITDYGIRFIMGDLGDEQIPAPEGDD